MTTIDGVLAPHDADEAPTEGLVPLVPTARPHVWRRLVVGFVLGFLLAMALAAGGLLAYDASHEGRALAGVSVGGVDLSGMDYEAASATLEAAFAGYGEGQVIVETTAGDVTIPYADFDRRPDIPAMVDAAMAAGRSGTVLERAVAEVRLAVEPITIEPQVTFDEAALRARIRFGVDRLETRAVDASIRMGEKGIESTPPVFGREYDETVANAAAAAIVRDVAAPSEVVVQAPVTVIRPAYGFDDILAARAATKRMLDEVTVTLGKREFIFKAPTVRRWVTYETQADGSIGPVVDQAAVAKSSVFKKIVRAVKRSAVSAKYLKTRGGKVVGVVPAIEGRKLDKAAMVDAIVAQLVARAGGEPPKPIKARTVLIEPKLTTAEAAKRGPIMSKLGGWKTWFPISERNYFGANIWRPAEIIDGMVLRPGQRFEWWSAIGPVTPSRGYGAGGFIAGGRTEPTGALGGGMCSSSTTLFNAALRAGLQMGARDNHKYYIDRYPLGLDATVSKLRGGGGQTMSFTNDMKHPIVIRSFRYRSGGVGWVRYEIWGIPDGRTVSLSKPAVSNVRRASTRTVYTSRLPKGVREQVEYPADGMRVSVSRVVRSKSGRVLHRNTYVTNYVLWNGIVEIGR
jgi:vancomycin resistance protein YoaR